MAKATIVKNITGKIITTPRIVTNGLLDPHLSFRIKEYAKNRQGEIEINDYLINVYGLLLRFSILRSLPIGTLLRLTFITSDHLSIVQFTPLTDNTERHTERYLKENVKISLRKPRSFSAAV